MTYSVSSGDIEKRLFLQPLDELIAKLTYVRRLERAWKFIEANYSEPDLTLEKVASISGANKNHLNTLLRRSTNFTFHQLLVRYRILKAISMVRAKNYSVLELALENGFGSINAFERNFRALVGVTPSEFKSKQDLW